MNFSEWTKKNQSRTGNIVQPQALQRGTQATPPSVDKTGGGSPSFSEWTRQHQGQEPMVRTVTSGTRTPQEDLQPWLNDLDAFSKRVSGDKDRMDKAYQPAGTYEAYQKERDAEIEDLLGRAYYIQDHFTVNKELYDGAFGAGTTSQLLQGVRQNISYLKNVRAGLQSDREFWGQFADEQEFNTYKRMKDYTGMGAADRELGQFGAGNIDLYNRPRLQNADGTTSTVRSITISEDGKEVVIPTVRMGYGFTPHQMTDQEAINWYHSSGEYLGKFDTREEAEAYAQKLHLAQEFYYGSRPDKGLTTKGEADLDEWATFWTSFLDEQAPPVYKDSGWKDPFYAWVNGSTDAGAYLKLQDNTFGAGAGALGHVVDGVVGGNQEAAQMTPEEIATYNYIYANRSPGEAREFYEFIKSDLYRRQREAKEKKWAEWASENPVGSSVFSILMSPMKGVSYAMQLGDYLGDGKIDQNAPYNSFSYVPAAIRGQVVQDIEEYWVDRGHEFGGKTASFLYQTGMSMGDFLFTTAVSGGNEGVALAIMGTGAAADATIEAKDRGLSDNQAFALGTIAGIAEVVTEKFSLDALLEGKWEQGAIRYIIKNAFTEGTEEVGSDAINLFADILIAKDQSQWAQAVAAYEATGMSESEAFWRAVQDQALSMGLDFLGGALSGGAMSGGSVAISSAVNYYQTGKVGKEFQNMGPEVVQAIIETGLESDPSTGSYQLAQKLQAKVEAGEIITAQDLGKLYQENVLTIEQEERAEAAERKAETAIEVAEHTTDETENTARAVDLVRQEPVSVVESGREEEQNTPVTERARDTQTADDQTGVEWAGTEEARRRTETQAQEEMERRDAPQTTERTVLNDGRQQAGDHLHDGDTGRVYSPGTGEQGGGLAGGAIQTGGSAEQGRVAVERQNYAKSLRRARVSSAEGLGLSMGTDTPSVTVLEEGDWDANMRSTAERVYQETGRSVTYVLGSIPIRTRNGGTTRVRGVYTQDGRIILQADHMRLSTDQIADHEIFHDKAFQTPGLIREIEARITEQFTPEEFGKIVTTYIEKMRGVIDLPADADGAAIDAAYAAIMEEIFADAYAGINAFGAHAERYNEVVETVMGERGVARQSQEDAAATDRRTGPPEERDRYSYGGRNANHADSEKLAQAERLEMQGVDNETIRQETGWHRGADGFWRFEIDDSGMEYSRAGTARYRSDPAYQEYLDLWDRFYAKGENLDQADLDRLRELDGVYGLVANAMGKKIAQGGATLGDILVHDELFQNYPQLRNTEVRFESLPDGTRGQYDPEENAITISDKLRNAPEDTLIHEIQHAIQRAEGFTPGASPEYWAEQGPGEAREAVRKIEGEIAALEEMLEGGREEESADMIRADIEELRERLDGINEYLYQNTAGEIEARDAAARRRMTKEQRRAARPDTGDENTVFAERESAWDSAEYARETADTGGKETLEDMRERLKELNNERYQAFRIIQDFRTSDAYQGIMDRIDNADDATMDELVKEMEEMERSLGIPEANKRYGDLTGEIKELSAQIEERQKEARKAAIAEAREQYTAAFAKEYADAAEELFGTTDDFSLAGYLDTNGELLDFSQGQRQRVQDHREIADVLDFLPEEHEYSDPLIEFMNLGNIRVMSGGVEIATEPNARQREQLLRFFEEHSGEVIVDFCDQDGRNTGTLEYERYADPEDILEDIDEYFRTGEIRRESELSKFREKFSMEDSEGRTITKEQQEFFRDSKVVDDKGRLIVAYHGTNRGGFTRFEVTDDIGYFFTNSLQLAHTYSGGGGEFAPRRITTWEEAVALAEENDMTLERGEDGKWVLSDGYYRSEWTEEELDGVVAEMRADPTTDRMNYAVYLNIKDPLIVEGRGQNWNSITDAEAKNHAIEVSVEDDGKFLVIITDNQTGEKAIDDSFGSYEEVRAALEGLYGSEGDAVGDIMEQMREQLGDGEERAGAELFETEVVIEEGGYWADPKTTREWVRMAEDMGADGVIFRDIRDSGKYGYGGESGDVYVVFDSSQVKSINNTEPTNDPDIRFSVEDEDEDKKKRKKPKAVAPSKPIIAKSDLRRTLLSTFAIPEGAKAEVGAIIDGYADRLLREGSLTEEDRKAFFDRMYSEGVMTVEPDEYYRDGRRAVVGGRVYVTEGEKAEFGDDWNDFRKRAFTAGVYLTSDRSDNHVDVWNMELADTLPGVFDPEETDSRSILERVVQLAEEGKDEKVSLAEYTARLARQEFIPESEFLDNMERQMDWALRTFAEKANLEIKLRERTGIKMAQERAERVEMAARQRERQQLRDLQQRTLKQLQWLSKNRFRAPEQLRATWDEVLGDIDIYAVGAANELNWSKKYGATWRDLGDMYKAAKASDPNFLPSKELERIVARLDGDKIADMDIGALQDLYKAAIGLRTEFYNRNNVINDETRRLFAEVYTEAKREIETAEGGFTGKKLDSFLNAEHLTPMNFLERMAGWRKDGTWMSMARQLEQGERTVRDYTVRSHRLLEDFLNERADWVKTADGQGKDAIWYEVEVPELLELGKGDKPLFGQTVKVYMTPAQKVQLYLESKNTDNLRHMTGGRTFVDKELYSKGKRQDALAQGKTIRLAPETVKALVSDLTEEEMELARLLEGYYNQFAKEEINRVSNILYGYDKAQSKNYAPIFTNQNYTTTTIGVYDTTAEGVGHMKSRQYAVNPSYNISAFDAFERHTDQTARFVGMAIPARNWQTLLNWREKNNSTGDVITHKWGEEGKQYIDNLLTELQGGRVRKKDTAERILDTALSRYISSVFGFNPSIVLKQAMSFPLAGTYLGWENIPNIAKALKTPDALIDTYTSELAYRLMGYATPETAQLKNNPSKLSENGVLKFTFGGGAITAMDGWTVKSIWGWAENMVSREHPELELGTQEQIDAGESPYYKEVAKAFEEAVSRSQPMYDVMHRAGIMRSDSKITRTLTLFKTVPIQQYNMLRQTVAEAQQAKRDFAAGKVSEDVFRQARGKAGRAVVGVILAGLGIEAINFLNALLKNKAKRYRDDEDELTWKSAGAEATMNFIQSNAGMIAGGDVLAEYIGSLVTGGKWYGVETPGVTQVVDLFEDAKDAFNAISKLVKDGYDVASKGGDLGEYLRRHGSDYLGELEKVCETAATYIGGVPANNIKAYALGTLSWVSPEFATAYEDATTTANKGKLSGLKGGALETRVGDILHNRLGTVESETVESLAELYEGGRTGAVPTDTPSSISVNGESVKLGAYQQQFFDRVWRESVAGTLDELVGSTAFRRADEETQEKMVKKLYDYAAQRAKTELFENYTAEKWVAEAAASGDVAEWIGWKVLSGDNSTNFYKFKEAGLDNEAALALAEDIGELSPEVGKKQVSNLQKFRAIIDGTRGQDEQMAALSSVMGESEYARLRVGVRYGITPALYVEAREVINDTSPNQDEAKWAIKGMPGLTTAEAAILWQLQNKSWKPESNPFSRKTGRKVYNDLNAGNEEELEGLSLPPAEDTDAGWADVPGLSLPSID